MSQARTIVKNVGFLFGAEVLTNALSLGLVFAIARSLGDVGLGKYSFALSFATLFIIFSDFGTLTFLIKEIAKDKTKAELYVKNVAGMKLVVGIVALALSIVAVIAVDVLTDGSINVERTMLVGLAAAAMFFNYFGYLFRAVFQAFEVMEFDAATKLLERVLSVGAGIVLLVLGFGIGWVLLAQVGSFIIFFIVSWFVVSKKVTPLGFAFDWDVWKSMLKNSLPFWLTAAFIYIYFKADTVILSFVRDYAEVGWYNASYKLMEALAFVQTIVVTAVFPAFSRFHAAQNKEHASLLFQKAFYYLFSLGLALLVGGFLLAPRIIRFIYGPQFEPAIPALRILLVTLLFIYLTFVMGYLLNAIDKGSLYMWGAFVAMCVNVGLNVLLLVVLHKGFIAAAWVRTITEIVGFSIFAFFLARYGYYLPYSKLLVPILAAAAMGVLIYFLPDLHLLLLVPLGGLVFFGVLALLGGIGKDEIDTVRSLVNR